MKIEPLIACQSWARFQKLGCLSCFSWIASDIRFLFQALRFDCRQSNSAINRNRITSNLIQFSSRHSIPVGFVGINQSRNSLRQNILADWLIKSNLEWSGMELVAFWIHQSSVIILQTSDFFIIIITVIIKLTNQSIWNLI